MVSQADIDAAKRYQTSLVPGAVGVEENPDIMGGLRSIGNFLTTPTGKPVGQPVKEEPFVDPFVQATPQSVAPQPVPIRSTQGVPVSIAAPGVTNNLIPPTNFTAPRVGTGQVAATQSTDPNISAANIFAGPDAKNTRAAEIESKYNDQKSQLESQLHMEQSKLESGSADSNPNKVAALRFQLNGLDSKKQNALQLNDKAFGMYATDADGNVHLDPTKIKGPITPRQNADLKFVGQKIELSNLEKAQNAERAAVLSQVDAQTAHNDAVASTMNNLAQEQKSAALDKAKRDAIFQAELQQKNNDINKSIDDFNSSKVNPNQYWQNQSTGSFIGELLSAALVGGLNAANGIQGNQVLSRIDQQIANDIDAQKANIANKGKGIELKNNALASFERQGYDKEQAIALTQAASYDAIKTQLQAKLATTDNAAAKASGQLMIAQLDKQKADRINQALTPVINASLAARTAVPGTAGGTAIKYDPKSGNYYKVDINNKVVGLATGSEAETYEKTAKLRSGGGSAANNRYTGNSTIVGPNAERYVADNPKIAEAAQGKVDYLKKAEDAGDRLIKLGTKVLIPTSASDYDHNQQIDQAILDLAVSVEKWENPSQGINAETLHDAKKNYEAGSIGSANNRGVIQHKLKEMRNGTEQLLKKLPRANEATPIGGDEGPATSDGQ